MSMGAGTRIAVAALLCLAISVGVMALQESEEGRPSRRASTGSISEPSSPMGPPRLGRQMSKGSPRGRSRSLSFDSASMANQIFRAAEEANSAASSGSVEQFDDEDAAPAEDLSSCDWTSDMFPNVASNAALDTLAMGAALKLLTQPYMDAYAAVDPSRSSDARPVFLWEHYKHKINNILVGSADGDDTYLARLNAARKDLQLYNKFRREFVDTLLAHVIASKCPTCTSMAMGSTKCTSDYDITVDGPNSGDVVVEFNRLFKILFTKLTSATVFDTNVYGIGWFQSSPNPCYQKQIVYPSKNVAQYLLNLPDQDPLERGDARDLQHRFAFMKVFQYLGDVDTILFHYLPEYNQRPTRLASDTSVSGALGKAKGTVEKFIHTFIPKLAHHKIPAMQQALSATIGTARAESDSMGAHFKWFHNDEKVMRYRNDQYGEYCRIVTKVKDIAARLATAEDGSSETDTEASPFDYVDAHGETVTVRTVAEACWILQFSISETCFYGAETYWTEGAFNHVVGVIQAGMDLPLTDYQLVDSMLENFGDFVKEMAHALHPLVHAIDTNPLDVNGVQNLRVAWTGQGQAGVGDSEAQALTNRFIINSSKYMYRLFDAAVGASQRLQDIVLKQRAAEKKTGAKRDWAELNLNFGGSEGGADDSSPEETVSFATCMRDVLFATQKTMRGNSNLGEDAVTLPKVLMEECTHNGDRKNKSVSLSSIYKAILSQVIKPMVHDHYIVHCMLDGKEGCSIL